MKYIIASDIHGSAFWCKKLIQAFEREKADKMILLGDILYHGPRNDLPTEYAPKKVIEMLNALQGKVVSVRGNCDAEVETMVLNFPVSGDFAMMEMSGKTVFLTHGHIYNKEKRPPLAKGDILVQGHTHVPVCEESEDYTLINPGSVSIPKENSYNGYILLDGNEFIFKTLDGEIKKRYKIV